MGELQQAKIHFEDALTKASSTYEIDLIKRYLKKYPVNRFVCD